jgi:hypothetical protein
MGGPDNLDDLFATARRTPAPPSEALMARVLADALEAQPRPRPRAAEQQLRDARPGVRPGLWVRFAALFGGAGALAGMGTVVAAGFLIGFVQPGSLAVLGDAMLGTPLETVELVAGVDGFLGGN